MEKDLFLISVSGKARSGKDTFAELLADEFFKQTGMRFVMMAYAQELKLRIQRDFDLSYEQLWGDEKEIPDERYEKIIRTSWTGTAPPDGPSYAPTYWTPREIMQFVGTDCFRYIDPDFWVKALFRTIEDKEYKNVIITDARFPNEVAPVSERGGFVVKVVRDDRTDVHGSTHASEIALDEFSDVDFLIENNGTLEDLRKTAVDTVDMMIKLFRKKEKENKKNG